MHSKVIVESSARLHLGFYNIISKNVAYGSLGVAVSEPKVVVSILKSKETAIVNNTSIKQLEKTVLKTINMLELNKVKVVVEKAIPRHVGLGSTTQLMLSIGYGISSLYKLNYSIRELAARLKRGTVSGIGIATFEKGGFVIDSGRIVSGRIVKPPTKVEELPQIIYRKSIPKNWFFTVIIPKGVRGLTEREEKEIVIEDYGDKDKEKKDSFQKEELPGYSSLEVLSTKDFSNLNPFELEKIKEVIAKIAPKISKKRLRRRKLHPKGDEFDLRRSIRKNLAMYGGEIIEIPRRRRKIVDTSIILLCESAISCLSLLEKKV